MEHPPTDIPSLIHALTRSPPSIQAATIHRFFLPTASFTHPLVRTGSWDFSNGWNSRWAIETIYRWYKTMSPRIDLVVSSVAWDGEGRDGLMESYAYATVRQKFRIWFVPFYEADVELVVRLGLTYDRHWKKWYVRSQEDCYPLVEVFKFAQLGLWMVVSFWQLLAMGGCVILAWLGAPVAWAEERWSDRFSGVKEVPKAEGRRDWDAKWATMNGNDTKVVKFFD